jgi:hypothetical protein
VAKKGLLERLNRAALALAWAVAEEGEALLAGNLSNSWVYDAGNAEATGAVVRAMAEAPGRAVPSSRYSPNMALHPMLGSGVRDRDRSFRPDWRDD